MKTEEDEAFEELERAQGWRNDVIEEIARAVEGFRGAFGDDTVNSFAIYIRRMKR